MEIKHKLSSQVVIETPEPIKLEVFVNEALQILSSTPESEEVVIHSTSVEELRDEAGAFGYGDKKPEDVHPLPAGYIYRFSGFADCILGVVRVESNKYRLYENPGWEDLEASIDYVLETATNELARIAGANPNSGMSDTQSREHISDDFWKKISDGRLHQAIDEAQRGTNK